MAELSFNRLMDGGTFKLDDTTKSTIAGDLSKLIGAAVTIVGNKEAGYGTADKPLLGIVQTAQYTDQGSDEIVITVLWNGTFENVKASGVTAGDGVTVDGAGGLQKATSGAVKATVLSFETDKAIILMK